MTRLPKEMMNNVHFSQWFTVHWMRAGIVLAAVLLLITPVLALALPWVLLLVYLQLPIYMIHQYEEHANGAFQHYMTEHLGHGRMVLSAAGIFWVNVGLVWGVDIVLLLLAALVNPVWGMVAVALPLVNGTLHLAFGIIGRAYNPGLWTSLLLFLPVGVYALFAIGQAVNATAATYVLTLLAGALLHAPIALFLERPQRTTTTP